MAGGGDGRKLDETPTWAVASVCAVIIIISFALEKGLHKIGTWLSKKQKTALYEALDRIKGELMVLGFISLLLTFSQSYIGKIRLKSNLANTMLPCEFKGYGIASKNPRRRSLLWNDQRVLASTDSPSSKEELEPLVSPQGVHDLHILIFLLAVFHVLYSALTMFLGRLKIRGWKEWERETTTAKYDCNNDPSRIRFTHETSFVRAHSSFWTRNPLFFYVGCFFRQFFKSVTKTDYVTLRNGFVTAHLASGSKFDFQKYIKRSLEDDFKLVVSVSPLLWTSFVIFLLLNVHGWQILFWASIIPPFIILAVGTKLQAILTTMALDIKDRQSIVQGMPLVQGSDSYFWFSKPQLVLHLLHFSLFQNAFQLTYILWVLIDFNAKSCLYEKIGFVLTKVFLGIATLILCSYSTLPLYALVSQMGSHFKRTIFDEQTSNALKRWHEGAKKKKEESSKKQATRTLGVGGISKSPKSSLRRPSSGPSLHRFMTTGHYKDQHDPDHEHDEQSLLANSAVSVDIDNAEIELKKHEDVAERDRAWLGEPAHGRHSLA